MTEASQCPLRIIQNFKIECEIIRECALKLLSKVHPIDANNTFIHTHPTQYHSHLITSKETSNCLELFAPHKQTTPLTSMKEHIHYNRMFSCQQHDANKGNDGKTNCEKNDVCRGGGYKCSCANPTDFDSVSDAPTFIQDVPFFTYDRSMFLHLFINCDRWEMFITVNNPHMTCCSLA